MERVGENTVLFPSTCSTGGEDAESGHKQEQVSNIDKMSLTNEAPLEKMEEEVSNDGHVDNIDKWVASLERILEDVPHYIGSLGHPGRISRIPENLREVDVKGYEPYYMSIGPYHNGKTKLQSMEIRKRLALKRVLEYKPELTLKDYLHELWSIESIARSFYLEVEMDSEHFVRMLLLDSVYIVTTLCGIEKSQDRMDNVDTIMGDRQMNQEKKMGSDSENLNTIVRANDWSDGMSNGENWHWAMFAHDLFLIENQLPLFDLQLIHTLVYGGVGAPFIDILKYEVNNMLAYYTKQDSGSVTFQTEEIHHLLHLCHIFFRPKIHQEYTASTFMESSQMFRLGNAVQLYEAGVNFEARSVLVDHSLLDITFDRSGKMVMPCLHVDDNTESLLRNLIALEQMKYPSLGLNISAYIVLLLHLITIPKDVELLRRNGIIQHHLASDKEMMYLINRLSTGLAFDYVEDVYSLKHVFHELKYYSECRIPRWKAWLKHRHFSNLWTTMSLLVATIFLLLTNLQTFYAIYSYYYPFLDPHY